LKDLEATVPTRFYTGYDSSSNLYAEFNAYADDERIRVELDYIPLPTELIDSDTSIPLIPREHRPVLEYGAAYYIMVDKEDQKAATYFSATKAKMMAMREDLRRQQTNYSKNKGRLVPRLEDERPRTVNTIWL